jgi:outer membrane lipoprotein-sorting protein
VKSRETCDDIKDFSLLYGLDSFRRFIMNIFNILFVIIFFIVLIPAKWVQAFTADEIIQRANIASYYAGDDGKAKVKMELVSKGGKKRLRELTILRKDIKEGESQKFYIYFHEPRDVSRMVFMVWKNVDKDDDRWLYIPAIDLVKRIATRDKRSSFAGSDFTYEDVSGRWTEDDEHTLIKEEDLNGKPSYVIKNLPRNKKLVEFSYYLTWIDKETFLPLKVEYYDKREQLHRVISAEEIKVKQGFPTVVRAKAENLQTGHATMIEIKDISYNVGIGENIFEERFLRRPPRRWIK